MFPNPSSRLPQQGSPLRKWRAFTPIKLLAVIAIVAAAFLLTGCGKKTETPPPVTPPQVHQPAQPVPVVQRPEAPAPATTPNVQTNAPPPDLGELSREVRSWAAARYDSPPATFEQWVALSGAQIPPPPPGKKYAFDRKKHVILVDR